MKFQSVPALSVLAACALMCQSVHAQMDSSTPVRPAAPLEKPADNSVNNKADPSNAVTADAQKNDRTDLGLTQQIRKRVMADKSLSTYAHNVKIVAVDGTVTLNGVVRDTREKHRVAMMAQKIAGKAHVVNDLKVAPPES